MHPVFIIVIMDMYIECNRIVTGRQHDLVITATG